MSEKHSNVKSLCSLLVRVVVKANAWSSWQLGRNRFESAIYRYASLGYQDESRRGARSLSYQGARIIVRWALVRFVFWPISGNGRPVDFLFKSFAYQSSVAEGGDYEDPFFGELPNQFDGRVGFVLLGMNDYRESFRKLSQVKHQEYSLYGTEHFFNPCDVVRAMKSCRDSARQIRGAIEEIVASTCDPRDSDFLYWIDKEGAKLGWNFMLLDELHYWIGKKVAERLLPKVVLMTHEGNGWERSWIRGIKEGNPKTRVIGFQHSVLPSSALGNFETREELDSGYCPDLLVCNGKHTAERMRKLSDRCSVDIIESCALRYGYLYNGTLSKIETWPRHQKTVLVAVEGALAGVEMVNFIVTCAMKLKNWKFRLRMHPSVGWEAMKTRVDAPLPENIEISNTRAVGDDIIQSAVIFYWGSTVALEAVFFGVPLIRYTVLDGDGGASYDPLEGSKAFKWEIASIEEFEQSLIEIQSLSYEEARKLHNNAQLYVQEYLTNPGPNELESLVERVKDVASMKE